MKSGAGQPVMVTFLRSRKVENDFGEPVDGGPTALGREWAQVNYGRGVERREAAMESAKVPATLRVRANSLTRSVNTGDVVTFDDGEWDIESNVPFGRGWRDITAVRNS